MKTKAFNFIELLIVIAVIGILISLIFPSLKKSRVVSYKSVCQSNLRQAGIAHALYAYSHDKSFPVISKGSGYRHMMGRSGDNVPFEERPLNSVMDTRKFSECPADVGHPMFEIDNVFSEWGSSYTTPWNKDLYGIGYMSHSKTPKSLDSYEFSDKKIIMGDHPYWANREWNDPRSQWHSNSEFRQTNLLFLDMHVNFFTFPPEYNSFPQDEPLDPERWGFY
ncbi:MAG: type II secretion system GspH family protein [Lentisphaeraceae bacterium]|nr:type II secretion system GspH family protein [Lentisphaeraceae bacterium]